MVVAVVVGVGVVVGVVVGVGVGVGVGVVVGVVVAVVELDVVATHAPMAPKTTSDATTTFTANDPAALLAPTFATVAAPPPTAAGPIAAENRASPRSTS